MLKPRATATRDLVNLDGVWRFAVDAALAEAAWSGPLDSTLGAATHARRVYVDDVLVAGHECDHTPFETDIIDVVATGEELRLTVGVKKS
ncbi:hypothetical protein [Phytoactinopolyspora halotolerans]|uniref:Uncharacterized protein n=1 Tax=Phytoactinopolyspora halotolerans TaxID=1981512 RepID=A0A6L9SH20_9ACTN|nr:hypothetical protein [Phytoactinopolyspora halotolerans]NEE04576.1 hypothetical protein [Phytoactinopolyspora halotolerans]